MTHAAICAAAESGTEKFIRCFGIGRSESEIERDHRMPRPVTGSLLYDLVRCPHRVTMDLFGDAGRRDPTNPFVELLWERGNLFEKSVIANLAVPFVDLSAYSHDEKVRRTEEAIANAIPLIYSGRIQADDLVGEPDLLRREGNGYVPGDIKSGAGEEGSDEDAKPKKHYAVQLALYADILEKKGLLAGRRGFVWDVHGDEIVYDLTAPQGMRNTTSLWDVYQDVLATAHGIIGREDQTRAAYCAECKLCHWYHACLDDLSAANDLTLIPELGRSKRDVLIGQVATIRELAQVDAKSLISDKKMVFPGIGPDTLIKFVERAKLLSDPDPKPYLKESVAFPVTDIEIFFDIETDPMRDICYLHGFVERRGNGQHLRTIYRLSCRDTDTRGRGTRFQGGVGVR